MKRTILFLLTLTSTLLAHAQNPGIPYQATLLAPETQLPGANSGIIPLKNTDVCLRFTFKNASGTEYQETQTATTSEFGRIDLVIGYGTPTLGSFSGINWDGNQKTMEVDIDYRGLCANFEPLAINEFQYVPYAFFALNAGGGSTTTISTTTDRSIPGNLTINGNTLTINVDDNDNDPTNEIELPATAALNQVLTWDGSAWVARNNPVDADSDPANEIQDLTLTGNTLKITGNTSATDIDLTPYLDNTDNQIIVSADTGNLITAGTDLGALITSIDDADADPANEIQDLTITSNTLKITGNASATDIDLTPYLDNTDNQIIVSADTGNLITAGTDLGALITSIDDADADPANEIQDLTITSNILKITGNASATDIDLTPYLDNTDSQIIVSTDTGNLITAGSDLGALITSIDDADADPANEIQDLTITSNTLKITGNASATDIDLTPYLDNTDSQIIVSADAGNLITAGSDLGALITSIDDADADPANEIQDLTITSNTLKITGNASATDIDLTPYLDNTDSQIIVSADAGNLITAGTDLGALITSIDDADADPANEIQDLTITSNTLKITGNTSATDIDLTPYLDNTDNQIIVSADTGNLITAGTDLGALITSIDDADADPANEIQDLTITSNTLKITGNASATDIDLTPYLDNTDNQIIVSADTGNLITAGTDLGALITSIDDADADPANEIQDLAIAANILKITGNASATDIDLSPYLDNTDSQTATDVSFNNFSSSLSSTNVQTAIIELENQIVSTNSNVTANFISIVSLENNKVSKSGDVMTGSLSMTNNATLDMGSSRITNVEDPINDQDAATKAYVDRLTTSPSSIAAFDNNVSDSSKKYIGTSSQPNVDYNIDNIRLIIITNPGSPKIALYDLDPNIYNGISLTVIATNAVDVFTDPGTSNDGDSISSTRSFVINSNYTAVFTYYNYRWYYYMILNASI